MKKEVIASVIFLLIIIFFQTKVLADQITGEVITGEATSATTGLNITITNARPALNIISPTNSTYFILPIVLNYTVNGENATWYVLDSGSNTTLTSVANLTVSSGAHNLFVYANSSNGSTTKNVTFGYTPIMILYMEYFGSTSGDSTNFNSSKTHEAIQSLSNVVLENTNHGELRYNVDLNITNDDNYSDYIINFDSNVEIAGNQIYVNTTNFPGLNKSAQLTILNVDFNFPQILLDGALCSTDICDPISYSYTEDYYIFNVTQLGNFSIRENPNLNGTDGTTTTTTGGGGGGGIVFKNYNLNIVTPGFMEISQNEQRITSIVFENIGDKNFRDIELSVTSTNNHLRASFEKNQIDELMVGERETINLFITSDNLSLGDYELEIVATTKNSDFTEKEKIYIKAVESIGKEGLLERINSAKEFLEKNPKCDELKELLEKAKKLLEEGKLDESSILIQDAISLCNDRIKQLEFPLKKFNLLDLFWILFLLIIIVLIILLKLKRKEFYACKRCRHTWKIKDYKKPKICPKCKSPYWNMQKKKKTLRKK